MKAITVKSIAETFLAGNEVEATVTELRKVASELKIKNYTKYKRVELVEQIVAEYQKSEWVKIDAANELRSEIEKQNSETIEEYEKNNTPREGTKSAEILEYMKNNPEFSKYAVAKHFDTYYSVVDRVVKKYLKR